MIKYLFAFLIFALIANNTIAQSKTYTDKEYANSPLWINMIKDTSVNYHEAEHAFKVYFQHHAKPAGEHEIIGEYAKNEKHPSLKEQRKMQYDDHLRMEIKKYERWHDRMLPYVKADGTILTPTQRLNIWSANKINN